MSFPSIPDTVYKLLVFLGIIIFAYADFTNNTKYSDVEKVQIEYGAELTKLRLDTDLLTEDIGNIEKQAALLSSRYGVPNPLKPNDTAYSTIAKGRQLEDAVSDSITKLLVAHADKAMEQKKKGNEIDAKKYIVDRHMEAYERFLQSFKWMNLMALTCFGLGLLMWMVTEINKEFLIREQKEMQKLTEPRYRVRCQSCGRKFNSMIKEGKEKDGTINHQFCINCYDNGTFTNPDLTKEQVLEEASQQLKAKKKSWLHINDRLQLIEKLDRWSPNDY